MLKYRPLSCLSLLNPNCCSELHWMLHFFVFQISSHLLALRRLRIVFACRAKTHSQSIQSYSCCSYLGPKCSELRLLRGNWGLTVHWESSSCTHMKCCDKIKKELYSPLRPPRTNFLEFHCIWHLILTQGSLKTDVPFKHICLLSCWAIWCSSPRVGEAGPSTHEDTALGSLWRVGWQKILQCWDKEWKQ